MPRLLVFAVCRDAIIDAESGTLSIINLFSGLSVPIEELQTELSTELSLDDIGAPMNWCSVSSWRRLSEDKDKDWVQRVEVIRPDGKTIGTSTSDVFTMQGDVHTVRNKGSVFPVGIEGDCVVRLSIKEVSDSDWKLASEYIVTVKHEESAEEILDTE